MVVQAAHANGKWVGICGEMASDRHAIPILVGLGVDEFSVTPRQIPMVKQAVRNISLSIVKTYSQRAIELTSAKSVRELVDEILSTIK
jgi:phosphocarrier protein FPr